MIGLLIDILEDLEKYNSAPLMASVLCAMNNICCNTARNSRAIVKDNGASVILQVMKKYPTDISVLDYASAVLANISREVTKGEWIETIVNEGVNITKKLLEADVNAPIESIVSCIDLYALLAKSHHSFRKTFGGIALPLIKDLLVKYRDTSLYLACTRALAEFFKCSDNYKLVQQLDLVPLLLNRLETETNNSLVYLLISALNSLLWNKTSDGKDHFLRYLSIVVDRFKKGFGEKKLELSVALILGHIAHHDAENLKLIKSFQISKMLADIIKKSNPPEKYNHILNLFKE